MRLCAFVSRAEVDAFCSAQCCYSRCFYLRSTRPWISITLMYAAVIWDFIAPTTHATTIVVLVAVHSGKRLCECKATLQLTSPPAARVHKNPGCNKNYNSQIFADTLLCRISSLVLCKSINSKGKLRSTPPKRAHFTSPAFFVSSL